MNELRLSAAQRITGVVWGLIVTGAAVTAMVALSGTEVDLTNVVDRRATGARRLAAALGPAVGASAQNAKPARRRG